MREGSARPDRAERPGGHGKVFAFQRERVSAHVGGASGSRQGEPRGAEAAWARARRRGLAEWSGSQRPPPHCPLELMNGLFQRLLRCSAADTPSTAVAFLVPSSGVPSLGARDLKAFLEVPMSLTPFA